MEPRSIDISARDVHVWTLRKFLDVPASERAPLCKDELQRLARFTFDSGQREYFNTRLLVRQTLSRYADVEPAAWRFSFNEHGRPAICYPEKLSDLRFNVSHTRGLIAVAVTRDIDVGIDVEVINRLRDPVAIADRFFAADEVAALRALPPEAQRERFFAYWTLKEAYIKARGLGLAIPLGSFAFDIETHAIRIAFSAPTVDSPSAWQFMRRSLSPIHRFAMAVRCDVHDTVNVRFEETEVTPR